MAFNFEEYEQKCQRMTTEELHTEWENYNREVLAKARSIATSVLLSPLTAAHTALTAKGGILGKAYQYYRKNSTEQKLSQTQYMQGAQPKHGYEPTPLAVWTNTSSIENVTEQVETLDIEQDLGYQYAAPHVGLHPTKTWPANYQAHLLNNGTGLGNDPKTQNKPDLTRAKQCSQGGISRSMSIKSITIRNGQNKTTTMNLEEETLFIRGRLLQLEMQRRGDKLQPSGQNAGQIQQTTELEVVVEEEVLENTGNQEVHTSFQFWQQDPVQQLPSVALVPAPAASLGSPGYMTSSQGGPILQAAQIYPTVSQQVVPRPEQISLSQTAIQVASTPGQPILHTPPEYQTPLSAPVQVQYSVYTTPTQSQVQSLPPQQNPPYGTPNQPQQQLPLSNQNSANTALNQPQEKTPLLHHSPAHTPRSQAQEQSPLIQNYAHNPPSKPQEQRPANHRRESHDSGYYSAESTPTAYILAPPSFGLPPTAEVPDDEGPDDFIPQDFGLPPETVTPHLSDQHHVEPIVSASAFSPVVESSLNYESWAPPEIKPLKVEEQNAESYFSVVSQGLGRDGEGSKSHFSLREHQIDATVSNPTTSAVVERSLDFQSWAPPKSQSQQLNEENTRYSISAISQGPVESYLPYQPPDVQSQTHRNTRSQSVPTFPWKEPQDQYPFSPVSISPIPEHEPRYIAYSPS